MELRILRYTLHFPIMEKEESWHEETFWWPTPNSSTEEQFLKEYTRIMRYITDALNVLQGEKNFS
jgi:hypothetical protein